MMDMLEILVSAQVMDNMIQDHQITDFRRVQVQAHLKDPLQGHHRKLHHLVDWLGPEIHNTLNFTVNFTTRFLKTCLQDSKTTKDLPLFPTQRQANYLVQNFTKPYFLIFQKVCLLPFTQIYTIIFQSLYQQVYQNREVIYHRIYRQACTTILIAS